MSEPEDLWGEDPEQAADSALEFNTMYRVDPEKIKTIEDVARIIDALDIRISPVYHNFEKIKDLLKRDI